MDAHAQHFARVRRVIMRVYIYMCVCVSGQRRASLPKCAKAGRRRVQVSRLLSHPSALRALRLGSGTLLGLSGLSGLRVGPRDGCFGIALRASTVITGTRALTAHRALLVPCLRRPHPHSPDGQITRLPPAPC
jgi:hypothetical protein